MKPKELNEEQECQIRKERYLIELITGKKWQWVVGNYTLPELIRLQGAMLFYDMI